MQTKKKLPTFYLVLIICWAVALALLASALLVIRTYLADYERTQPKHLAEKVFEEYFSDADFGAILDFSDTNDSTFESKETLSGYLSSIVEGKVLSYHSISSGTSTDVQQYVVKYNENEKGIKIASFTLSKTGEKSKKGFDKYALEDFELFYPTPEAVAVKVPKGAVPYINGVMLDESYITEDNIESDSCLHMPEGVEDIKYTIYTLEGLVSTPDVTVKSADNAPLNVFYNEEANCYEAEPAYDEALAAEQSEYVISAAEAYAAYMQNDIAWAKVSPYFEKGTALYNSIRSTLLWAVIDHDSYHFENAEASQFYRYDDNTFSCRVKLTHVLKRSRLEDYRDYMDVTFYLRKIDGVYRIYDRVNN